MSKRWKIVDQHGDEVVSAEAIQAVAVMEGKSPRQVALRDARDMVNTEAGDAPVYAVPAA